MNRTHEHAAAIFCESIKTLSSKPENIENLYNYLSMHFERWLEKWANTPEGIAEEMKNFAEMI